jgi:hypothetical protein
MEWIGERPRWIVAGLIVALIGGLYSGLILHITGAEQAELLRHSEIGRLIPDEQWEADIGEILYPSVGKRVRTAIFSGIGIVAAVFIYGLVLFGVLTIGKGAGSFNQISGIAFWAALIPYGLKKIIAYPLVLWRDSSLEVSLGLAAIIPVEDMHSASYQAIRLYGDLFSWWYLALTAIGIHKIVHLSPVKSALLASTVWLFLTTFKFLIRQTLLPS